MNRMIAPVVLLVCAKFCASVPLYAQARGPAREVRGGETPVEKSAPVRDEATRARMFAEAQAWLGRLVGRFEVDQKEISAGGEGRYYGTAECSHIGGGSGVQCSIYLSGTASAPKTLSGAGFKVQDMVGSHKPVQTKKSSPLLFFGINPDTLEIQLVLVDLEQVTTRSGMLADDEVTFADNWNVCYRVYATCWMAAAVTAQPAGEIVMKFSVDGWADGRKNPIPTKSGYTADYELRLRRERQVDVNGSR